MTIAERPLFGKAEIQRLTDVWVEQRRNLVANPTPGTTTGWSGPYPGTVTADGYTVTNTATTTPYIFSTTSTESIVAGRVYAFRAKVKATPAAGSVFTNVNVRPHKNVGNVYYNMATPVMVPANGVEQEVAFYWTATANIPASDAFNLSIVGNGTGLTGSKYSMRDVLIEDVGTALPSTPPAAYFAGSTSSTDNLIRNRWTGTTNASASVQESRRVNFIQNATQVSYRRGGARSGIGTKTDVGLMTFTLHNDEDPLNGGTFQPGQEVRLVAGTYTPERTVVYPAETVYSYGFEDYKEQTTNQTVPAQVVYSQDFSTTFDDWEGYTSWWEGPALATNWGDEAGAPYDGGAARTVTGLVVGRTYTLRADVLTHGEGVQARVGVAGKTAPASTALTPEVSTPVQMTFTATETSHTLEVWAIGGALWSVTTLWDNIVLTRNAYTQPVTTVTNNGLGGWTGSVTADLAHTGMYCLGGADNSRTFTGLTVGRSYTLRWWEWNGSNAWVQKSQTFTATATSMLRTLPGFLPKDDVTLTRDAWSETFPAVNSGDPIFTGRVVDVKSTYPLNKATGKERTSVTVTVADAVNVHGGTMRYGVQIAEGFETFESRINRLASSALAPIEPPVQGAPKVVYSF